MNNSETAKQISPKIEMGAFADNLLAYFMIIRRLAACQIKEALGDLYLLQQHIKGSKEVKSQLLLLPRIETQILLLEGKSL